MDDMPSQGVQSSHRIRIIFNLKKTIKISHEKLIQQLKFSLQLSSVIESVARQQVIQKKAEEINIIVSDSELQKAADHLRIKNNLMSSDATWQWLNKNQLTIEDLEEFVYAQVFTEKLAQHLYAQKVDIFFAENLLEYAQAVLYEIILDDFDLAMELYYTLQENEMSFPEIARLYIQDPELRRSWGYRGKLSRTDLKPEISAAVFAANPPQILKPILIGKKAYLIWVEEIIQPVLTNDLRTEILEQLFSGWLNQQVEGMDVSLESS